VRRVGKHQGPRACDVVSRGPGRRQCSRHGGSAATKASPGKIGRSGARREWASSICRAARHATWSAISLGLGGLRRVHQFSTTSPSRPVGPPYITPNGRESRSRRRGIVVTKTSPFLQNLALHSRQPTAAPGSARWRRRRVGSSASRASGRARARARSSPCAVAGELRAVGIERRRADGICTSSSSCLARPLRPLRLMPRCSIQDLTADLLPDRGTRIERGHVLEVIADFAARRRLAGLSARSTFRAPMLIGPDACRSEQPHQRPARCDIARADRRAGKAPRSARCRR